MARSQSRHSKVQTWVFAQNPAGGRKVLLLKTKPERGSFWQPVTGSVEEGESVETAATREALEETGLEFRGRPQPLGFGFDFESRFGPAHEEVFVLEALQGRDGELPAPTLDPKEHVAHEWLEPRAARSRLKHDSNRQALDLLIKRWDAHPAGLSRIFSVLRRFFRSKRKSDHG